MSETSYTPPPVIDLSEADLDALIARLEQAIAHDLALSAEDLRLVLQIVLSFGQLHERLSEKDITLHKLRKLAGLVSRSEKLRDLVPTPAATPKPRQNTKKPAKPALETVIHQRCKHNHSVLHKGQVCPECQRGKLYHYAPQSQIRFTGQSPLQVTQHLLERLRCNTCGAYFTAELPPQSRW